MVRNQPLFRTVLCSVLTIAAVRAAGTTEQIRTNEVSEVSTDQPEVAREARFLRGFFSGLTVRPERRPWRAEGGVPLNRRRLPGYQAAVVQRGPPTDQRLPGRQAAVVQRGPAPGRRLPGHQAGAVSGMNHRRRPVASGLAPPRRRAGIDADSDSSLVQHPSSSRASPQRTSSSSSSVQHHYHDHQHTHIYLRRPAAPSGGFIAVRPAAPGVWSWGRHSADQLEPPPHPCPDRWNWSPVTSGPDLVRPARDQQRPLVTSPRPQYVTSRETTPGRVVTSPPRPQYVTSRETTRGRVVTSPRPQYVTSRETTRGRVVTSPRPQYVTRPDAKPFTSRQTPDYTPESSTESSTGSFPGPPHHAWTPPGGAPGGQQVPPGGAVSPNPGTASQPQPVFIVTPDRFATEASSNTESYTQTHSSSSDPAESYTEVYSSSSDPAESYTEIYAELDAVTIV